MIKVVSMPGSSRFRLEVRRRIGIRAFAVSGETPARTLDEVLVRMEALGAVADECQAVRRTVGIFLRWAERRQPTPDRTAGIAWLRAVSQRLEPERQACVKASGHVVSPDWRGEGGQTIVGWATRR
jgi:hypothetical protein